MHPALEAIIQDRRAEIDQLCRRHGVRRLEVFGSAGGLRFEPARSDIDFLVELAEGGIGVTPMPISASPRGSSGCLAARSIWWWRPR